MSGDLEGGSEMCVFCSELCQEERYLIFSCMVFFFFLPAFRYDYGMVLFLFCSITMTQ